MTDSEIYQLIANRVSDSISENWDKATVNITRVENSVGFSGNYSRADGTENSLEASFDFFDGLAIHELHAIITKDGKSNWNKLKFVLSPDGNFETFFVWDQQYQDQIDNLNQ